MGTNWTFVYRPRKLEEVLYHDDLKELLTKTSKPFNIIFYGPNGTGKTSIAKLFATELDYPFLYIDCYEENWTVIYDKINTFQESLSLTHPHITKKIIIIDNINDLTHEQQHGLYKLLQYSHFFLIGNHCHQLIGILRSKFIEVFIPRIPTKIIVERIQQICKLENRKCPNFHSIPSSLRQAISAAQFQPINVKIEIPEELKIHNLHSVHDTISMLQKYENPENFYIEYYKNNIGLLEEISKIEFGVQSAIPLLSIILLKYKAVKCT